MPGIPVVIAANGRGIPVRQVASGAPMMRVATNGKGIPIVLTSKGAPFVVAGTVNFAWRTFTMTAGGTGQWVGYSDGGSTRPQPAFGSINMQPTLVTNLLAFYDDTASGVMLAVFSGDYVDELYGVQVSIGGYVMNSFEVELISGNTWVRFNGLPGDLSVGALYEVRFI